MPTALRRLRPTRDGLRGSRKQAPQAFHSASLSAAVDAWLIEIRFSTGLAIGDVSRRHPDKEQTYITTYYFSNGSLQRQKRPH